MALRFGSLSWKFPSWTGLVYSRQYQYAAYYLPDIAATLIEASRQALESNGAAE
ncbi:MAG: hypothetical protein ACOCXF_04270 [bacterium]